MVFNRFPTLFGFSIFSWFLKKKIKNYFEILFGAFLVIYMSNKFPDPSRKMRLEVVIWWKSFESPFVGLKEKLCPFIFKKTWLFPVLGNRKIMELYFEIMEFHFFAFLIFIFWFFIYQKRRGTQFHEIWRRYDLLISVLDPFRAKTDVFLNTANMCCSYLELINPIS